MAILGYKNSIVVIREFGLAEVLKRRGLAGWLEIATDDLEASAQDRIAKEIGAHYSEAVSAHMMEGEPELSARMAGLAELGDPEEAAKRFRKSHLTESEVKSMQWMAWKGAKPLLLFWMLPLDGMPVAGLFLLLHFEAQRIPNTSFFAVALLLYFTGRRLIPRLLRAKALPSIADLKRYALSNLIFCVSVGSAFDIILYTRYHDVFANAFYSEALVICWLLPAFRTWNKLRNMTHEQFDLPPPQATSS